MYLSASAQAAVSALMCTTFFARMCSCFRKVSELEEQLLSEQSIELSPVSSWGSNSPPPDSVHELPARYQAQLYATESRLRTELAATECPSSPLPPAWNLRSHHSLKSSAWAGDCEPEQPNCSALCWQQSASITAFTGLLHIVAPPSALAARRAARR